MGFRVPLPDFCRVFGKRNWEVVETAGERSRFSRRDNGSSLGAVTGFAAWVRAQRAARRYPSADLTMMPAAIIAARRS